jgi:hypothetical protein
MDANTATNRPHTAKLDDTAAVLTPPRGLGDGDGAVVAGLGLGWATEVNCMVAVSTFLATGGEAAAVTVPSAAGKEISF